MNEDIYVDLDSLLLPGENIILKVPQVSLLIATSESYTAVGIIFITNFQLLHVSTSYLPSATCIRGYYIISIPVMTINILQKKIIEGHIRQIKLYTKDMRCIKLTYSKTTTSVGMVKYLRAFLPISTPLDLFAFRHTVTNEAENGWKLYDPLKEYQRMGVFPTVIDLTKSTKVIEEDDKRKRLSQSMKNKKGLFNLEGSLWGGKSKPSPDKKREKAELMSNARKKKKRLTLTLEREVGKTIEIPSSPRRRASFDNLTSNDGIDERLGIYNTLTNETLKSFQLQPMSRTAISFKVSPVSSPVTRRQHDKARKSISDVTPVVLPSSNWTKPSIHRPDSPMKVLAGQARRKQMESVFPLSPELRKPPNARNEKSPRLSLSKSLSLKDMSHHRSIPPPILPLRPMWMITDINKDYKFSSTYPKLFCVPSTVDYELLHQCLAFRSRGRIPVLSWKRNGSSPSIIRSSQPLVGMSLGSHSNGDEKYLQLLLELNEKCERLHIVDARGRNAANANHARGAGFEGARYMDFCSISFMGIDNIHTMRESLGRVFEILKKRDDGSWYSSIENTGWLKHIRLVLIAAQVVVDHITEGDSVLVHCSDGWDRTAQICAIAELALDPYFRTIEGFLILIEKEWIQFGHKFAERHGHCNESSRSEISPVFLQFLDCVHQLLIQYPCSFEFNQELLVYIMDEVFSCRFGTFLGNSALEIEELQLPQLTPSLWGNILSRKEIFRNRLYAPNNTTLSFSCSSRVIKFWDAFFLRWDCSAMCKENSILKTNYLIDNLERRHEKLQAMHRNLELQLDRKSKRVPFIRHRLSSVLAMEKIKATTNVEITMRAIVMEIIEEACTIIRVNSIDSSQEESYEALPVPEDISVNRPWIPEHWINKCTACEKKFTQLKRKHHCRNCGRVFCHNCSKYKSAIPKYDITSPVRVCDDCYQSLCNENGKSLERSISDYSSGKQNHRSRKNTTTAYGLLPTKLL